MPVHAWKEVGRLRAQRTVPIPTRGGKLMSVHHLDTDEHSTPASPDGTTRVAGPA